MIFRQAVVYLYGVSGLCSAARNGERTPPRRLLVPKDDAVSTSYPIVPLENRQYKIKVAAFSILANDAVEKLLYVVVSLQNTFSYILLEKGGKLTKFMKYSWLHCIIKVMQ